MVFAIKKLSKIEELPLLRFNLLENMKYVSNQQIVKYSFETIDIKKTDKFDISNDTSIISDNEIQIDSKSFQRTFSLLSNNIFLLQRISPHDNIEAIIIAIYKFNICIIEAKYPLKQFRFLISKKFSSKNN